MDPKKTGRRGRERRVRQGGRVWRERGEAGGGVEGLIAICKHAPVFVVKVSRPYFSTRPQGVRKKFGVWGRD